jgi:hypothetical protein
MQKIIMIAAVFAAGFIAGTQFNSSWEPAPVNESVASNADVQQLQDQIAALTRYVEQLESRPPLAHEPPSPGITQPLQAQRPVPQEPPADATADELARLREYQLNTEIGKHQARLQTLGADARSVGPTLEQQFAAEAIDAVWANDKKVNLDAAIEQDNNLRVLPSLSSECRSQQCRLSVLTTDADQLASLNASLNNIVTQQQLFDSYTVVVDEENYRTQIYFERAAATH